MDEKPPLLMRLWQLLPLPVIRDFDFQSEWGRAKPGESWACLCGGSYMIPLWRVRRD